MPTVADERRMAAVASALDDCEDDEAQELMVKWARAQTPIALHRFARLISTGVIMQVVGQGQETLPARCSKLADIPAPIKLRMLAMAAPSINLGRQSVAELRRVDKNVDTKIIAALAQLPHNCPVKPGANLELFLQGYADRVKIVSGRAPDADSSRGCISYSAARGSRYAIGIVPPLPAESNSFQSLDDPADWPTATHIRHLGANCALPLSDFGIAELSGQWTLEAASQETESKLVIPGAGKRRTQIYLWSVFEKLPFFQYRKRLEAAAPDSPYFALMGDGVVARAKQLAKDAKLAACDAKKKAEHLQGMLDIVKGKKPRLG